MMNHAPWYVFPSPVLPYIEFNVGGQECKLRLISVFVSVYLFSQLYLRLLEQCPAHTRVGIVK